jgi:NAD(P)-dependent dehydrogenase (short-subunit alcohol dehydrogenase family)
MSNDNAELPQQLQQQHHVLRELFDVSGKKVVVTGGASGIGRMLVEGLVKQGAQVLTCSRKIGSTFATELNACGYAGMCYSLQVDVTVDDDLDRLHEYASAVFDGRLDVLVCASQRYSELV